MGLSLALLEAHDLALVADALALVRVGLALEPYPLREQPHLLLVVAEDDDARLRRRGHLELWRDRHEDLVREADAHHEHGVLLARVAVVEVAQLLPMEDALLDRRAEADAVQLELLAEAL